MVASSSFAETNRYNGERSSVIIDQKLVQGAQKHLLSSETLCARLQASMTHRIKPLNCLLVIIYNQLVSLPAMTDQPPDMSADTHPNAQPSPAMESTLLTPPKNEGDMLTQSTTPSPERDRLLRQLQLDHECNLEMCQRRYSYMIGFYTRQISRRLDSQDDQYDHLLAHNHPLRQAKQEYETKQERSTLYYSMLCYNAKGLLDFSKNYEKAYYHWVREDISRQSNLFRQYLQTRNDPKATSKRHFRSPQAKVLISAMLHEQSHQLEHLEESTLCRILRIADYMVPQKDLKRLRKQFRRLIMPNSIK